MAKKRNRAASGPTEAQPLETASPESMTTFSIRLSDEQRDLVMRAAELRGWTPTNLIRTATLERAAHVVNTSRLTKFDFKALASEVARRLFESRTDKYYLTQSELEKLNEPEEFVGPPILDVWVQSLPIDTLLQFKRAARLGGAEFVNLIVDFAEGLTASQRGDLPDPIDPATTAS